MILVQTLFDNIRKCNAIRVRISEIQAYILRSASFDIFTEVYKLNIQACTNFVAHYFQLEIILRDCMRAYE